ncbi:hypothetical protein FKM82_003238 [Ascaphus truei]
MAPKKTEQKKNLRHVSSSTSLGEPEALQIRKLIEDELEGDDLELLCQLENHLHCIKNRYDKKGQRKEKSKKNRKKGKTLDMEIETLSELCKGRENTIPLKDSNQSIVFKKKTKDRKKKHCDFMQSCPQKKKCKTNDPCKSTDTLPIKRKKGHKKKHSAQYKILHLATDNFPGVYHSLTHSQSAQGKKSLRNLEGLNGCVRSQKEALMKGERKYNVDTTENPEPKKPCKNVTRDTTLYCSEKQSFTSVQPVQSNAEEIGDGSSSIKTNATNNGTQSCLPFNKAASSPLEHKVSVVSPNENSPKQDDACSNSDHSQDLFITQKSFLPVQVSSSNSSGSPPLGQEQVAGTLESIKNYSRTDVVQLFSQVSTFSRQGANQSNISQCHLTSVIKNSVILMETATQTDDLFSYLAIMSFLNKTKVFESCSEQPLDLSLPTRIRAGCADEKLDSDDLILLEDQPGTTNAPPTSEDRGKLSLSQLRRYAEGRYVQALLNSSYFFKGKGEPSDKVHMTPLLKQKPETKKRVRKSVPGLREKKERLC